MCCFSGPVNSVSATKIFARMGEEGRQFLVYSMTVDMEKPLAMVLPLPVRKGSDENAVRFINLEKYNDFFGDLDSGFPKPRPKHMLELGDGPMPATAEMAPPLPVMQVGNFEASFVPTVADFNRLDARFQLPAELFAKMPEYRHFGFAVFKLKPGAQTLQPMAFEFPTDNADKLFFPTVHIHDGEVHPQADFDHSLYCQRGEAPGLKLSEWKESPQHAGRFVDAKKSKNVIAPAEHCYKRELHGMLANKDTCVVAA